MNNYKLFSLLAVLSFCTFSLRGANAESNDTVKTTQLDEVVVKGENQWISNGKAVFIPTRQAKRLAPDMETMIDIMNTPMLIVSDGTIKTSSGQAVSLFINGQPVDQLDKSTFWANNVIRVEFYPTTDDPQFLGQNNVVNFIMKEYVAGGLTHLTGQQSYPSKGLYSLSSKLVFKRMTYNFTADGGYSRDHLSHFEAREEYDDVWYDGEFYDIIARDETSSSVNRNNYFTTAANARYRADKFAATHGITFSWDQNPGSGNRGSVFYTPSIISSGQLNSLSGARSSSVRLNGSYWLRPKENMAMWLSWYAGHNHNNNNSEYTESGTNPIDNYSRENAWTLNLYYRILRLMSQKFNLHFAVDNTYQNFRTTYWGTSSSVQKMDLNQTTLEVGGAFNFSSLRFQLIPKISIFQRNVNSSFKQTDYLPGVSARVNYQPRDKMGLYLHLGFETTSPGSSYVNDLILRQTELKWIEGNPGIKPSDLIVAIADWSWMPLSWFSMNESLRELVYTNEYAISYRPGGIEYDGIIGQYMNGLTHNEFSSRTSFTFRPFGSLQLRTILEYEYQTVKGMQHLHQFRPQFNASWFFSDFSISMECRAPEKSLQNGGMDIYKTDWTYNFKASYGNGRFMCSLNLDNIFNKYRLTKTTTDNGPFHSHRFNWNKGREIRVWVTYYFGYGKKVTPDIDMQDLEIGNSSVLGAH